MRKIITTIVAISLAFSNFSGLLSCADSNEYYLGDVDMNNSIDTADLLKFKKVLLGFNSSTKSIETLGDINQDGKLSTLDFLMLKRILLGLEEAPDVAVGVSPTVTVGSIELQNGFVANWTKNWDKEIANVSIDGGEFSMEQTYKPAGGRQSLIFNPNQSSSIIELKDEVFSVNDMSMNLGIKSMTIPTGEGVMSVITEGDTNVFNYHSDNLSEDFSINSNLDENFAFDTTNVITSIKDKSCEVVTEESMTTLRAGDSLIASTGYGFKSDDFEITLGEDSAGSCKVIVVNSKTGNVEGEYSIVDNYKMVKSSNYRLECIITDDWAQIGFEDYTNGKYYGLRLGDNDSIELLIMERSATGETVVNRYTTHYNADGYKGLSCSVINTDKNYNNLWNFEFLNVGDCGQTIIWKSDNEYSICYNEILSSGCSVVLEKVKNDEVCQNEFTAYGTEANGKIVVDSNSLGGLDYKSSICYGRVDDEIQSYYGKVEGYGLSLTVAPQNGNMHSLILKDADRSQQVLDCNFNYDSF